MNPTTLYSDRFRTSIGEVLLMVDGDGALCRLSFLERGREDEVERELCASHARRSTVVPDRARCAPARARLEELLAGEREALGLELRPYGTEFQQRVWAALREIPRGETRTYAELARAIGSPKAVRAVGRANATNPVAVAIPCHRVIGADGTLTGFFGGVQVKRALLTLEGVDSRAGSAKA